MKVVYKLDFNLDKLHKLQDDLKKLAKTTVDVGVIDSPERGLNRVWHSGSLVGSGPNNATIGRYLEYGSYSQGIAARPWLEVPLMTQVKPAMEKLSGGTFELLPVYVAEAAVKAVKDGFSSGGNGSWAPNAPFTIRYKSRNEPGIDTEQLRDSIKYRINTK